MDGILDEELGGGSHLPRQPEFLASASEADLAHRPRWPALRRALALADVAAVVLAATVSARVAGADGGDAIAGAATLLAAWVSVGWLAGIYAGDDLRAWATGIPKISRLLITALVAVWPHYGVLETLGAPLADVAAVVSALAYVPVAIAGRTVARGHVHRRPSLRQRVLIVGSGVIAARLVGSCAARRSSACSRSATSTSCGGEMSLVGPRPLIEPEATALSEAWHARRQDLWPGLTGPWQISGRSDTTVEEMVRFDYTYVAGWSLARDLEIVCATVPAVLSGRGAY